MVVADTYGHSSFMDKIQKAQMFNSNNEREIFRNQIVMLFSNEYSSHVELYLIFTSVVIIEEVKGSSVGDVKDSSEHDLSFSIEVNPVHWWV